MYSEGYLLSDFYEQSDLRLCQSSQGDIYCGDKTEHEDSYNERAPEEALDEETKEDETRNNDAESAVPEEEIGKTPAGTARGRRT